MITRAQLLNLGLREQAIKHRVATGQLHPGAWRGVYAVGRPQLSRHGTWMAAVLSCGPGAALSHESAAALWQIRTNERARLEVSVPAHVLRRRAGISVHRRALVAEDLTHRHGIPVTTPVCTLVDLATRLPRGPLEAAVKVDFHWPDLRLVVETDGLGYHRTPAQQARDRVRDQAHAVAGLTPLRFTRAQVVFEPAHVEATLSLVARRLRRGGP